MKIFEMFFYWLDIPSSEERKRAAYREKITECMNRAEQLKDLLQQERRYRKDCFHSANERKKKEYFLMSVSPFIYLMFYKLTDSIIHLNMRKNNKRDFLR